MRIDLYLLLLASLVCASMHGQSFVPGDLPEGFDLAADTPYGNGLSLLDFNDDGWPDLTVCRHGLPTICFENINGQFQLIPFDLPSYFQTRHFNWVDIDNDGDLDACITSAEGYVKIFEQSAPGEFVDVTALTGIQDTPAEFYSSSWGDYDGDGLLDLYLPVYEMDPIGEVNALYHNLGNFVFENVAGDSPVHDGQESSFIGTFVDFDNDVDADLFVINDREASYNHLYENTDGEFQDISGASGIEHNFFPMTNTVGDYDNNGYLDFFMTNNPVEKFFLMANNGDGTFSDVSEEAGVQGDAFGWGANFLDYDNDGWLDLQVNTMPFWVTDGQNYLFKNNGDGTFEDVSEDSGVAGEPSTTYCSVIGDIDNDGRQDFITFSEEPFGLQIWMNETDAGHWLKVTPKGQYSNSQAVGTRVVAHTGDNLQMRYTLCGESFLAQNSQIMHFGLGDVEVIDSLVVTYPSGVVDTYYDIPANTALSVMETETHSFEITTQGQTSICAGDSVTIGTVSGDLALWNTGDTASYIVVYQPGTYFAFEDLSPNVLISSDSVVVVLENDPAYSFEFVQATCTTDSSYLSINAEESDVYSLDWEGPTGIDWGISLLDLGTYTITIATNAGCSSSETFTVDPTFGLYTGYSTSSPTCNGQLNGAANINLGPSETAAAEWFGVDPEALGAGIYSVFIYDGSGCSEWVDIQLVDYPLLEPGIATIDVSCYGLMDGQATATPAGGSGDYTINWLGTDNSALAAGTYPVLVSDSAGCTVETDALIFEPDPLVISFDEGPVSSGLVPLDITVEGGTPPYTFFWTDGISQWDIEDPALPVSNSYELLVTDENGCEGFLTYVGIDTIEAATPTPFLWPNPTEGQLTLYGAPNQGPWTILDQAGRLVHSGTFSGNRCTLDVGHLTPGLYCLRSSNKGEIVELRFSKL